MSCPARMSDDSICASPRGALFLYNVGNGIRVAVTSEAVFRNRFRRLRFLRFDAFGNLHCTKCYFWKDCCLPRITRRSKIACSSQFTLRYLDKIHIAPDLIECRLSVSRYSGFPFRNNIFARIDCEIYFACLHASTQVSMLLLVVHYQTKVCHCSFDAYHA